MRARSSVDTSSGLLMKRETVAVETPATCATSRRPTRERGASEDGGFPRLEARGEGAGAAMRAGVPFRFLLKFLSFPTAMLARPRSRQASATAAQRLR